MYTIFNQKYQKEMITVLPGERYASEKDIIIATVLGSCVSIVLFDSSRKTGGLNHFMLPGGGNSSHELGTSGKYGIHALPLLIEDLESLGCRRHELRAKIFGGGRVLQNIPAGQTWQPRHNVDFAEQVLHSAKIPVVAADVGGDSGRKILFFPTDGKVLVRKLSREMLPPVVEEERDLIRRMTDGQK